MVQKSLCKFEIHVQYGVSILISLIPLVTVVQRGQKMSKHIDGSISDQWDNTVHIDI